MTDHAQHKPLTQAEIAAIAERAERGAYLAHAHHDVPRLLATVRARDADIARMQSAIDTANVVADATIAAIRELERLIRERGGRG